MKIGHALPNLRLPALVSGKRTYPHLDHLKGQWANLCFLSQLAEKDVQLLHQQVARFEQEGARLLVIIGQTKSSPAPWADALESFRLPFFTDPLHELHRAYGLPRTWNQELCQHLILNQKGICQYHLVHTINDRGFAFAFEMLKHCQDNAPAPRYRATYDPHARHCTLYEADQ